MAFEPVSIFELDTPDRARQWVTARLGRDPVSIVPLSGGVSNTVLLVDTGAERLVVKQSLPQLRVEAEWFCDRNRILRECDALKLLAPMLPAGSVPAVVDEDPTNCAFIMTAAPASAETWKARLLRGDIDAGIARRIGEILGAFIESTRHSAGEFSDLAVFDTLRLDAYYRYTAARHPDLADYFHGLIADCETSRVSLVHGDFSPKNILVDGQNAVVIDWECVHYGNPAFDAAFLLNHLLLKSFHMPDRGEPLAKAAETFWRAIGAPAPEIEDATLRHWGGLLLARMDGKSPVEYIVDAELKQRIRTFARDLIARQPQSVAEVFHRRSSCP